MWHKYKISDLNDLIKIDNLFLDFLKKSSIQFYLLLKQKRALYQKLTSDEIIEIAKILEEFLINFFNIKTNKYKKTLDLWQKILLVKKDFIQRNIALKYNNFEGSTPNLITEEEFAEQALFNPSKKLENYARFALFTKEGKERHKNGTLFKLPHKNPNLLEKTQKSEVIYKGEGCFKKNEIQNFSHTKYCIYCHKQNKDYCRTENPIVQKNGCPLNQNISEMNLLKAYGNLISPLACIMIENPLCILTGDRICNDCKKACIFQKQEAVDVPSIESQILLDVLKLDYGFEIYSLLLNWNPLLTSGFLPQKANGKRVLICGAGPSGIANVYYFTRAGFEVLMIDGLTGLNINKLKDLKKYLTKPLKSAYSILNKSLEERSKGAFGGVMEYGITSRFNKNFLTLCQILLEREPLLTINFGVKFGTNITLKDAKKMGFAHILMCLGAGKPNIFNANLVEKGGIFTASNFLMSGNFNKDWIKKNIKSPIAIFGGGLTAMDCAFLLQESLQNTEIMLFYRKEIEKSPSFLQNEIELFDVLHKNIKIFEDREIIDFKFQNNNLCSVKLKNLKTKIEEYYNINTAIFAFGTNPNIKFLPSKNTNFITTFGDLNKNYEGSVVKAIASVKDQKDALINSLQKTKIPKFKMPQLEFTVVENKLENGINKLKVKGFLPKNPTPFEVFKVQDYTANHSVPLTLFKAKNNILTFYFEITGEETKKLANLPKNTKLIVMKASSKPVKPFNVIVTDKFNFIKPLGKIFKNIVLFQDFKKTNKKTLFYLANKDLLKTIKPQKNYYYFDFKEMNCMLSGVCSRCIKTNKKGETIYACDFNIFPL